MTTPRSGSSRAGRSPRRSCRRSGTPGRTSSPEAWRRRDGPVFSADATSGTLTFTDGPYVETKEFLGGLTVVDVPDEATARMWAGKIAEACGWPQEVRLFKRQRRVDPT